MAIELVDLAIENGAFPYVMLVYQRVRGIDELISGWGDEGSI